MELNCLDRTMKITKLEPGGGGIPDIVLEGLRQKDQKFTGSVDHTVRLS